MNPDFVVCPGVLSYGVEVKRPVGIRGAVEAVKDARDQLNSAGMHGVVILDLTDALDDIGLRRFVPTASDQPYAELRGAYRSLTEQIVEVAWDSKQRTYKTGFQNIMSMWFTARGWRWVMDSLDSPQLFEMQGMQRITSAKGNVWHHRAEEFFNMLIAGLGAAGWYIREAEQEAYEPILRPFWEG